MSKCGNRTCYVITTRNLYECTGCHYQASVIVGTVMEKTHLPLEKWFWGIYFVAIDKRGCSAAQLANELEISYTTAWYMLHRIRKAMKDRDEPYTLSGIVELDDAYFGAPKKGSKRGRGTEKAKVIIGLSISDKGHPQYLKMEVVDDLKEQTIAKFAQDHIDSGSTISSDAYRSYAGLQNAGYELEAKVFNPEKDSEHLKWLHMIVSNAKAVIHGTFHGLGKKHMPDLLPDSANDVNLAHPTLQKCAQRNWLTTNLSALFQNKRVIIKLVIILGRCLKSISALLVHELEVFI